MIAKALLAFGAFIALLNLYTSFFRERLHHKLKPQVPYKSSSGFPLIGTALLGIAWWLLPSGSLLIWVAAAFIALDTGGPHWFLLVMFRQL